MNYCSFSSIDKKKVTKVIGLQDKSWLLNRRSAGSISRFQNWKPIMGINYNPRTTMYWSADEFYCNPGIKKVMPRNRFDEIKRFLHFSDSSKQIQRGEEGYDRLYKVTCTVGAC